MTPIGTPKKRVRCPICGGKAELRHENQDCLFIMCYRSANHKPDSEFWENKPNMVYMVVKDDAKRWRKPK